ncbi:hypothetical protein SOVF_051290 [Spinacia oleracea]|uniref:Late embryogenesis abundant protein LEA-2 subgroup domain-containing protein n=1 Tax=Spinacia oleracea TaxID=3562 RepID=A0A9R0ICW9_SPIOL|nr:uncharacterized protein LOC110786723 [Spinacia oleracea]KNA20544.1 hypothetical protein SOVF_051290 [Spinacia oleracea]
MHAKTDSEVTSLSASSPNRSPPRRPVYYVQSPSRDSHDGEKTTTSFQSTPVLSPAGSPPHSHSSVGRHSRESSSTRFSGSLKPGSGSRKISPNDGGSGGGRKGVQKKNQQPWKECDVIEEEGLIDDEERQKPMPRRCYVLAFILGFFVLFSFFSLILWGAARPQKPKITVKSIKFDRFIVSAGSDATGVATEMASVNSTLKFMYRNTATFFGVHVTSSPLDLAYSQINVATGNLKKFYQSRKSQRTMNVQIYGDKIPLYGSGQSLAGTSTGVLTAPVNMTLSFTVRSRAYVLGRLVKPKFYKKVDCTVVYDPKKPNSAISLKKACTYQ